MSRTPVRTPFHSPFRPSTSAAGTAAESPEARAVSPHVSLTDEEVALAADLKVALTLSGLVLEKSCNCRQNAGVSPEVALARQLMKNHVVGRRLP